MLDIVDHAILRLLHEGMIDVVHNADGTSKIVLTKLGRQYGRRNSDPRILPDAAIAVDRPQTPGLCRGAKNDDHYS